MQAALRLPRQDPFLPICCFFTAPPLTNRIGMLCYNCYCSISKDWKEGENLMKIRLLALLLILAMLLGAAAQAETSIQSTSFTWYNAELSPQSKVLIVRADRNSGYDLYDLNGQPITDKSYATMYNRDGLFEVALEDGVNVFGAIDAAGRELMPMQYGDIKFVSDRWQIGAVLEDATEDNYDYTKSGTTKSFYLVTRYDVYFDGALVGSLGRTEYKYATAHGAYLIVRDVNDKYTAFDRTFTSPERTVETSAEYSEDYRNKIVYHNGSGMPAFTADCTLTPADVDTPVYNYGGKLLDLQGNVLGDTNDYYSVYSFKGDYAYVRNKDHQYGIIDRAANLVIPFQLSDSLSNASTLFATGYELVAKDGMLCWATAEDGVIYTSDVPSSINKITLGAFARYQESDGLYALITPLGKLDAHYKDVRGSSYSTSRIIAVQNNDKVAGVIGMAGEELIPLDGTYQSTSYLTVSMDGTVVLGNAGSDKGLRTYVVYMVDYDATGLALAVSDDTWICPACGGKNTTNFCPDDGTRKPGEYSWTCPACGILNSSHFCPEDGTAKP